MAKQKKEAIESVSGEDFFKGMDVEMPEGFEEVTRLAAKRLESGESVVGTLTKHEIRTGFNEKTGEESDYSVYTLQLADGTTRAVGGAPVLDSLFDSHGGVEKCIGKEVFMARGANATGKRGRTAGMYKLAVKAHTNGKAKA